MNVKRISQQLSCSATTTWLISTRMENVTEGQVSFGANAMTKWSALWFVPHLVAVYILANFCAPQLAGWTHNTLLPFLLQRPVSSGRFEFGFSHLLAFSFIPAFLTGLVNAKFKHRAAHFVWSVPTAILAYKFITFPVTTSVLQSQSSVLQRHLSFAFHQFFSGGFHIPEFYNVKELWSITSSNPDMARGLAQLDFTAPFYAGVAYSIAAWISAGAQLNRRIAEKVRQWEESRFGDQTSEPSGSQKG